MGERGLKRRREEKVLGERGRKGRKSKRKSWKVVVVGRESGRRKREREEGEMMK